MTGWWEKECFFFRRLKIEMGAKDIRLSIIIKSTTSCSLNNIFVASVWPSVLVLVSKHSFRKENSTQKCIKVAKKLHLVFQRQPQSLLLNYSFMHQICIPWLYYWQNKFLLYLGVPFEKSVFLIILLHYVPDWCFMHLHMCTVYVH